MPRSTSSVRAKVSTKKTASSVRNPQDKKSAKKASLKSIKPSEIISKVAETVSKTTKNDYSARNIQVLEGLEPVRKRPGMYIGSTDTIGLHECLREIVDNAVDEALGGFAKNVWILLNKDGSATVIDDGRGIPVDTMPQFKKSALEIVMTKLHAGGKFGGSAYKISGGLHGVGASVVNALSEWLWAEVRRDGKIYRQEYARGNPKTKLETVNKSEDFINGFTPRSGTTITFKPDSKIFSTLDFEFDVIKKAIRERAYLVEGLYFHLIDLREEERHEVNYYFEGGITALVTKLNENKGPIHKPIFIKKQDGEVEVEAAIQFNSGYAENVESYVNVINTVNGGTHLTGFRMALTRAINDYGKKIGSFKNDDDAITGDDTREGLTAVVFIKMPQDRIQVEGQTKGKLGNSEIQPIVNAIVKDGLSTFFEENPQDGKRILEKVYLAARARLAAKAAKEAVIRKGALEGSTLPGKLADCQEKNTERARLDKMIEHEEIKSLIIALGAGIGDTINMDKLRYHRIIIMTDADVDGEHIETLILTFFYRHLPEIVKQGYLYIAQPPLYKLQSGKEIKYAYSDDEKDSEMKMLNGQRKTAINVQRYKGLGEMNPEQLWETTMNPKNRILKQVNIGDAEEADAVFTMLMGDEVPPRKHFIQSNAKTAILDV